MMQAMIFAAGLGTRLKPLTDTMPKALVPVGGRPLLAHTIDRLREAGAGRIVVNVHHFAGQIIEYLKGQEAVDAPTGGSILSKTSSEPTILISDESGQLLDTGGGLRKAAGMFEADDPILIHNVDILSNANLATFYDEGRSADALLMVSERKTKRYLLFNGDMRLVGWTNIETGEVRSPHPDLDPTKCRMLAFSGIHIFSPRLFPLMNDYPEKFGIMDFYLDNCACCNIRGYVQPGLRLMDVGKLDTLSEAEEFIMRQ